MGPSWWQILIVLVLLVLLFGRGKISSLMSDVAKGIKSFKVGMADEGESDTKLVEGELAGPKMAARAGESSG